MSQKKKVISLTIHAEFDVTEADTTTEVLECINEAMDKLREQGTAEGYACLPANEVKL